MKQNTREKIISIIMIPVCLLYAYPFFLLVITTFKTRSDNAFNPFGLPSEWVISNYKALFETAPIVQSFFNSLFVTGSSVLLILMLGAMAAYPVVFNPHRKNRGVMLYLVLGFMIPFQSILIPLMELMTSLKLVNQLWGLSLFYAGAGCSMTFFLTVGFMRGIPLEIAEAARIDGASVAGVFYRIILPLLKPVITTSAIFHATSIWNDFLAPLMFINSSNKATMIVQTYRAKSQFGVNWPMFMTFTVISLLPIVIFFLILQKYILKGLSAGAVKG